MNISEIQPFAKRIIDNLEKVIVGKTSALEMIVTGLLCQGHLLIEDVPGVGKTMAARSLAKSLGCSFKRIQFTPDMLPSDVTGVSIFNQGSREFEFRPGPLMAQIVLVDEINRATPKTQSALLEAMEERQITVDGTTYILPSPFMVLATQNPIEYEGTFPLPEAQLDRFLLRVRLGYPSVMDEVRVLELQQLRHPIDTIGAVTTTEELLDAQETIRTVFVAPTLKRYIVQLIRLTRESGDVYLGASPRGSLGLFRVAQARAAMAGRDYVLPDDIKYLAESVLAHRIVVDPAARLREIDAAIILEEILRTLPVPSTGLTKQDSQAN
jgi:MoxR-like ATPase